MEIIVNAALFSDGSTPDFANDSLAGQQLSAASILSDDPNFLEKLLQPRLGIATAALDHMPIDGEEVYAKLRHHLVEAYATGLIIDMRWVVGNLQGLLGIQTWGGVADRLARDLGIKIISIYDQDLTIEEQMQAALRAHRQMLAPSGLHDNPFWIPVDLLQRAPLDEQLFFMLGRIVPEYANRHGRRQDGQMFARGATPSWITKPATLGVPPSPTRWHIHCLGELQVLVGNTPVEWRQPGGAAKKIRTLFAYLLQSGDKGAHADQIGELLWPEDGTEETKRARLHHTVAMLRKALGSADSVQRAGEYYRLRPPSGSWIDIDTFEQLCRRGLSLFKRNEIEAAFRVYSAADKLYAGDLFEDLPLEYVRSETDDWCMPRRIWLREMAVKLQYDFAKVCMATNRIREALDHCQKALAIDPTSEGANAEAMKIFVAQGRMDAMHRQFRQYRASLEAIGATEGIEIKSLYRELSRAR